MRIYNRYKRGELEFNRYLLKHPSVTFFVKVSGTLVYASAELSGEKPWQTVFEKRSPFYTTEWDQLPEVL